MAFLLAAAMALTLLTACGQQKKPRFVLRTYSTFGEESDREAYAAIIREYTKTHRNAVINDTTTTRANSYKMSLSLASTYRGAGAPDVIYYTAMKDMSELSDFFMTVDEIRADYPHFAEGVSEAALSSAAADDGGRYCIPVRGDWQGIIVNAALFRRSALKVPTTWEDVLRAAEHFQKNREISLFANSLTDSGALMEYLVRALGGEAAVRSAMEGQPDDCWQRALRAVAQLDELNAFPLLPPEAFDYLISPSDLRHTSDEKQDDPVALFNAGKAAILLIDNSMCGSIDADIDSRYIALPPYGTFSTVQTTTTTRFSYPTGSGEPGAVYPRETGNTLPPTQPPASGSGETASADAASTSSTTVPTTRPSGISPSDTEKSPASEQGLYVNFAEGFYITKKAYYNSEKREDMLALVEAFLQEDNNLSLCGDQSRVPALTSVSRKAEDKLTEKSNLYRAVIQSVQSADSFLVSTQTQENRFFWNHCAMTVAYFSKGVLTQEEALRLIGDTQSTAADFHQQRKT